MVGRLQQELLTLSWGLHVRWGSNLGTFVLLMVLLQLLEIATTYQVEIILKPPLRTD